MTFVCCPETERVCLRSSHHDVEIFLYGGLLNRFARHTTQDETINIVAAFRTPDDARANLTQAFRSAKLSPFACRLQNGQFEFAQRKWTTGKHFLNGHAIHGLLYDTTFTLADCGADGTHSWATLTHHFQAKEGYPFDYQITLQYSLQEDGLHLSTSILNTSPNAMPLVDGFHPYFTLGGSLDDWCLHINSTQQLTFNADLLPTGEVQTDTRFIQGSRLSGITLDNSFLLHQPSDWVCRLHHNNLCLIIDMPQNYPILQVYIPPERDCIALENLSAAPDAFNNGIGLITLNSQEERVFSVRYRLEQQA